MFKNIYFLIFIFILVLFTIFYCVRTRLENNIERMIDKAKLRMLIDVLLLYLF